MLPPDLIIITDLDGSLLDRNTYSWAAAEEALREIARRGIPLVFCTSKTRAEVEVLRRRMGNAHPFIVENGGGVFIPDGYFPRRLKDTIKVRHYHCLALGRPYAELIEAFEAILEETGLSAEGFHKMRPRDIARNSGLPLEDAQRAAQREFDLPFFFAGSNEEEEKTFIAAARERKLTVVRGTRFWHLFSGSDKGRAVRTLIELYRAALPHQRLRTVALGDCAHDLPMLAAADKAVLIPQRRDQFDEDVLDKLPRIIRAPAPGPAGWNAVVLSLLR